MDPWRIVTYKYWINMTIDIKSIYVKKCIIKTCNKILFAI